MIVPTWGGVGRSMRVAAYVFAALAGVVLLTQLADIPGISIALWWAMSVELAIGASSCLLGQLARRWTGEFVGLPLLSSALVGFGLLQANLYDWQLAAVPSTALLWSFALLMFSRWRDVLLMYAAAPLRRTRR
jgi:hypothetical protein